MTALAAPVRAGVLTLLLALTAVAAARTGDAAVAALGLAAAVTAAAVVVDDPAEVDPAWSLTLLVQRRLAPVELLSLWAAQGVGALVGGLAGRELLDRLPQQVAADVPDEVVAVGLVGLAALLGSWLVAAGSPQATLGLPTLVASAALPAAVTGALNPGVLVAVGLTGLVSWTYVLAASLAVAVAAVAGAGLARLSRGPDAG